MSITVNSLNKIVKVSIAASAKDKVIFGFKPLNYKTKSKITGLVTSVESGQLLVDAPLQVFFNIKYGLKEIKGVTNEKGEAYKLSFETKEKLELTDECVDELLATVFSDNLQLVAREFSANVVPSQFRNPLTGDLLEGVELVEAEGVKKK